MSAAVPHPVKIRRALISVYDKTGIAEFARTLHEELGVEIISTGRTAKTLREAGIPVTLVEKLTGVPELLAGRVKTLHPRIHAAVLADRDNPEHMRQLAQQRIEPIDMVVVDLYPFERAVARPDCSFEEALEMIDIGGPCLLRAAAKNHRHVLVVHDAADRAKVLRCLREDTLGAAQWQTVRRELAAAAFRRVTAYNAAITDYLVRQGGEATSFRALLLAGRERPRYGENPHQQAEVLRPGPPFHTRAPNLFTLAPERGAPAGRLSFNNYADASAALELCAELARELGGAPRGLKPAAPHPTPPHPAAPQSAAPHPAAPLSAEHDEPRASARAARRRRDPLLDDIRAPDEPRASARAAARSPDALDLSAAFHPPDPNRAAWLLTWTTYGSWLPGDRRGFVSRRPTESGAHTIHNLPGTLYDADRKELEESAKERMHGRAVVLTEAQAATALAAFTETAAAHHIAIIALSIMPDHVHILCQGEQDGARLMQLFKGASARRLSRAHALPDAPRWWTRSGSRRYLQKGSDLEPAVRYVCGQPDALRVCSFAGAARAEARGPLGASAQAETVRAEAPGSASQERGYVVCFIKHTNACGAAVVRSSDQSEEACPAAAIEDYRRA